MTSPPSPGAGTAQQFPTWARELLRCPVDHGELDDAPLNAPVDAPLEAAAQRPSGLGAELICRTCGLAYPVIDGIPVLLVDDARRPGPQEG